MAQNLDHRGAGTLLEGILTVKADINGNGWWTTEYGDGSTSGGSLSVSPAFEVEGVGFEVSRLSVILGDSVDFFLADQGFGAAGSGGLAEARRWVLHLDGQAYRFDAAALGATVAVWRVQVPNWQANTSAAIRIERLPRPDAVLNDDGSETLWDAMVGVEENTHGNSIGYSTISGDVRGSADPDEFDFRGTTYEVEFVGWWERTSSWNLSFQVDGTRRFPERLFRWMALDVNGERIAFSAGTSGSGTEVAVSADGVDDPGLSDGDDIDVQLILLNRPGAPREVAVAMDRGAGTATVTWLPPARNGGAPITGYTVERSTDSGTWTLLGTTDGETTTYTDTAPSTASRVLYRVRAENRIGDGPHAVDSVPAVVGIEVVSTPAENGTYRFGEPIDVVATFGRSVWVHGEAELALQFDGETVNARYAYGSGTPKLTYRYIVRNGDFTGSTLLVPKNALAHDADDLALGALGGGFVKSVRGVDARLGSPEGSNRFPGQRVDGSALFDDGDRIWRANMRVGESTAGDVLGYARGGVGTDGRHGTLSPDTFSHTDPDGNICQHAVHNVHYRQDAEGDWWFVFEFTGLPHDPFKRYGRLRFYKAVQNGSETLEAFVLADADRYERATHTTAAWWRTVAPSGHTSAMQDRHVSLSLLSPSSDPPTNLVVDSRFGAALKLTWKAPDEHGSAAINGYRIEHADVNSPNDWTVLVADTFSVATERFVRVGLGTSAYYRVRALGLRGAASEPSDAEHAATDPPDEDEAIPRAYHIWSATLTSEDLFGPTGYRGLSSSFGTLEPDAFRHMGTDHTVWLLYVSGGELRFQVNPGLPDSARAWTLEVAGRRFGLQDAAVANVSSELGTGQRWRWPSDGFLVAGESVPVRLYGSIVPIKRDSALIPDGVGTGERYRLLFVSSNFHPGAGPDDVDGTSFKLSDYDRAVRARAKAGSHRGNPIKPFADAFRAFVSTPGTDARDHVGTAGFDLFTEGAIPWQATLTVGVSSSGTQLGYLDNLIDDGALDPASFSHDGESYKVDDLYEDSDGSCTGGRELNLFMDPGGERLLDLGAVLDVGDVRFPLASAWNVSLDTFSTVFNFCDPAIGWAAGEEVRVRFRIPPDPAGDLGVPVYWLNGANAWSLPEHPDERTPWVKVADDYAELHGGLWRGEGSPRDEWGENPCIDPPCAVRVATGSRADGTADPSFEMGMENIRAGALNDPDAGGPLNAGVTVPRDGRIRIYGISPVLEVRATKPSIWGVRATDDKSDEIEVTWRLSDNGAPLTSLKVQERIGTDWRDATGELGAEARSFLFEDLIGTSYRRYRVVAVNREGRRISGWVTGKTVGPTRPRIQYFRASENLVNAIELSWAVRENGSDLTGLVVQELDLGTLTWSDAWTAPTDPPSGRHTFENLDDGLIWTVRLRATNAVGTTTSGKVTGVVLSPFIAAFQDETDPHDGAGTTFDRIVFLSEGGSLDAADLCDVLEVTDGTCRSSRKGRSQNQFGDTVESWVVTIAPDGDADVTLTLHAATDCDADGAVCSTDGRPLAETVTHVVAGPGSMQGVDLTAEFVADSVPARHEGAGSTFTPQVGFNQAVDVDDLCAAVEVTDGACTAAAHEVGDTTLWDLTMVPDGGKPVTVALPETTDCDAAGAVCTAADGPLTTAISATVKGPLLEASWASLPETHAGGGTTYTARVRFTQAVDVADLCDALLVTNGTCTAAATVGGDAALWEIEVEPEGAADLTLSLEFTTDCAAARAVCTADGEPLAYGVLAVVPRTPLTVAVESVPDDHGGIDTTFTVRVRFSEAVDVDGLCDAFYPHAATCDSSARVGGDDALWDVVFAPEGAAAAELALPGTADCADADAVCTADDEPLTGGFLEIVPRRPFTAAWVDGSYPANHEGAGTTFTVRVRFSEDAIVSYVVLRDEALEVDGGDCNVFRRVDGRKDLWEATIAPDGLAAVSLTLDSPADCDAADAVCTQDDVPLSTVLELTVPGPSPGNSVVEPMLREERPPRERR